MLPSSVIGGAVGALVGLAGADWDITSRCTTDCCVSVLGWRHCHRSALSFIQGSRYVPGAEIMLITLISELSWGRCGYGSVW